MTELPDLRELAEQDLVDLGNAVYDEQRRRQNIASAAREVDEVIARYQQALGREDGEAWTQPTGALDAYPEGATVTHSGKTWVSTTPANTWEPGVSGWREAAEEGAPPPAWVQPTGAHDAYPDGDRVTFEGQVWESLIPGNVWSPSANPSGWRLIEEDEHGTDPEE